MDNLRESVGHRADTMGLPLRREVHAAKSMPSGTTRSLAVCQPAPLRTSTARCCASILSSRAKAANANPMVSVVTVGSRHHQLWPVVGRT